MHPSGTSVTPSMPKSEWLAKLTGLIIESKHVEPMVFPHLVKQCQSAMPRVLREAGASMKRNKAEMFKMNYR